MKEYLKGAFALSPLFVFVLFYLVTSIRIDDFYQVPISVAFLIASGYAILIMRKRNIDERIRIFSRGAASENMMLMIWIFLLAGAFANSAKTMGAVDATVQLALNLLPSNMLFAGLFLTACFISLSIGTSVGTIVALTPIAAGIASSTAAEVPFVVAIVVGGAFFGDNLSFISDTTIVATTSQGCRLSDKFKVNTFLVFPVAAIVFGFYAFSGMDVKLTNEVSEIDILKVVPYLLVLGLAVLGTNVLIALTVGIIASGITGVCYGTFDFLGAIGAVANGMIGMGELIIVTMLAGGMLEVVKEMGGVDFIIKVITKKIKSKRGAELSVAGLVSLVDMCTANNTVAIITVGGIVQRISEKFGLDSRKCASILDTFSCFAQGIIPYGAQLLMAGGMASVSPASILPYLYYQFALGIFCIIAIVVRYPRRYS